MRPSLWRSPASRRPSRCCAGCKDRYEAHHQVKITDDALVAAARLSDRYVKDRRLPDKAIDLIDEAASRLRIAMHSLPPDLKELRAGADASWPQEEEAGGQRAQL